MLKRIWKWVVVRLFVEPWLRGCSHPSGDVAADILEGDAEPLAVGYCNRCGAVQVRWVRGIDRYGEWRRPRPLWCEDRHG